MSFVGVYAQQKAPFGKVALPYKIDALAPLMSQETLEYHYGKHLQAYINNVNKMVIGTEFEQMSLDEIVKQSKGALFNNAAQVWNHNSFFTVLSPKEVAMPVALKELLTKEFGSVEAFVETYRKNAVAVFGSGWVWLAKDNDGKLSILVMPNAGNPLTEGLQPILGIDVWEHSYYIDYRNNRGAYVDAFFKLVDWNEVAKRCGLN